MHGDTCLREMRICLAKILWSSKLLATPVMCLTQYRCCVVDETENVAVNQMHIYQRESHAAFDPQSGFIFLHQATRLSAIHPS